jgi:rhodanese-related sulfurtransferase
MNLHLIDTRTPEEYAQGHVRGATNIDVTSGDFAERVRHLDKGAAYGVYCQSGRRSSTAADYLKALGFANVTDLSTARNAAATLSRELTVA